jgi:NTP pyrophosphatase (non-canonical NTP hydrolase)
MDQKRVLEDVVTERLRQDLLWQDNTCANMDKSDGDKMLVLSEEVGEVAKSSLDNDRENLYAELIQVAAVAVAWAESL